MILIADSGSTKTDLCILQLGQPPKRITTPGLNPVYLTENEIKDKIATEILPQLNHTTFKQIHYYGAGCLPEKVPSMTRALAAHLHAPIITVQSDMLGAARALSHNQPAIIAILGTGSNSCFYDGEKIKNSVPPLGYILGDEGSGATLGKLLVGDILKNQLGDEIKQQFLNRFNLTQAQIIENVYKHPNPNRFLASLSPFIAENINHPPIRQIALNSFVAFIERNIKQYDHTHHKVHLTGSIAYHYRSILEEAAYQTGIQIGNILQSPLEGLIKYHSAP